LLKVYWILTLLLIMAAVGMIRDLREVISRWTYLPRGCWLRVVAATFLLPPLFAMLLVGLLPLTPEIRGGVLLMSVALAGPTIALSNTNRHFGLAMRIAGLNLRDQVKLVVPFFAAYALPAPLLMAAYAVWQRKRRLPPAGQPLG
jgi:hypothetical protein